jgi:hypothetical protein
MKHKGKKISMKRLRKMLTVSVMAMTVLAFTVIVSPASAAAADGDLIKMDGLSSVYYLKGGKRYVFPNEQTYFSWYSDWSGVKTVSASELQSYPLTANVVTRPGTDLVKITTDPTVYAVEPGGVLRSIVSEANAINLYGANWASMVRDVADSFFVNYSVGAPLTVGVFPVGTLVNPIGTMDIFYFDGTNYRKFNNEAAFLANKMQFENIVTTDKTITAGGAGIAAAETDLMNVANTGATSATTTPIGGSGLSVALASNMPAAATVIVDDTGNNAQAYIPFLTLNFTAAADGAINVQTVKLTRDGIPSLDTDLSNIQLWDGNTKIADYSSFTNGVVTFTNTAGLFTVNAGTTKSVSVTADLADAVAGSRNIKFSVNAASDIVAGSATISGSFPMSGNLMSSADIGANLLATAVVATVANGSGIEPGTLSQDLWKFRITGANKKVDLHKIKLTMIGTIDADDVQNLKLYQGSTMLGTAASQLASDKSVTFDISSAPFEINKKAYDFTLKGDIVGGTSRTYQFSVQSMDDVVVYDKENKVRIKPGSADTWTIIQAAAATTISTGSLTVNRTQNVATSNVALDSTDQVLASFDFKATGEAIKVTSLYVEANTSGGGINDAKVYVDGSQVGTTQDLTEDTAMTFALGNGLIIPAGTTEQVEIRGDVKKADATSFTAENTIVIYLSSADAGGADGNAAAYTKTISLATGTVGAVSGYSRTVKSGVLTTAVNASVSNWSATSPVAVQGATQALVGSFIATVGAGEAVNIEDVQILDTSAAFTELQNLNVKVNGTTIGTTVSTPVAGTTYTFSVTPAILAAASSQVTINVYADLKSGAVLASTDAIILDQVSATGVSTFADAKDAGNRTGQTLVSTTGGTLTVALSGNTPASSILVMGNTSDVPVAKFIFEETTGAEAMTVTQLKVKNSAATDTNLVNFSLWDGATQVGQTQSTSTSGVVTFSGLSVNVPAGGQKEITVKARANGYPNASASTANAIQILAGTTYVTAEGVASGPQTVTATLLTANTFEAYRTNLTMAKSAVTGDGTTGRSRAASQTIGEYTLVADTAYNAKLRAATAADALTESTTPATVAAGTWTATGTAAGTLSLGTTTPVIGTKTITNTNAADTDADDGLTLTFTDTTTDLTAYSKVGMWVRLNSAVALTAKVDSTAGTDGTTSFTTVSGEWQFVTVDLNSTMTDVVTLSVYGTIGSSKVLDIDNVQFYNDSIVTDITGDLLVGIPSGVPVYLKDASGTTKMTGYYSGTATAGTVTLLADSEISIGSTSQTFSLITSTSGLMLADTTANETLNVSIDLGNAATAGDVRWYDGAVTATSPATWVSGTTPISFSFGY